MSPSPCFVFAVLVVIGCSRAAPSTDASAPAIDRAQSPLVAPTVDVPPAPDVTPDVARPDARVDVARVRPSHAGARCDDRVGCGSRLVCCTHGGIPMPATHRGSCMTFRACNTIPAARGNR